jgi:uncharacterized protein YjbI with pentapeptide repeats|tara:strand:+ start:3313 stop:3843 length:531 start_codon:yes stop_codon:yes gene_type:complete
MRSETKREPVIMTSEEVFHGIEGGRIDFSNIIVKEKIDFRYLKEMNLKKGAVLTGAIFEKVVYAFDVNFEGDVDFRKVTFEEEVFFKGATFNRDTFFGGTAFKQGSDFQNVTFKGEASFYKVIFDDDTNINFRGAVFNGDLDLVFEKPPEYIYCDKRNIQQIHYAAPTLPLIMHRD